MRRVRRTSGAAGKVKLAIEPLGSARRRLGRVGRLRLRAKVTFAP